MCLAPSCSHYTPGYQDNSSAKYVGDTTNTGHVVTMTGLQEELNNLAECSTENNLLLNVSKTKELVVGFTMTEAKTHTPVNISGAEVDQVNTTLVGHRKESFSPETYIG